MPKPKTEPKNNTIRPSRELLLWVRAEVDRLAEVEKRIWTQAEILDGLWRDATEHRLNCGASVSGKKSSQSSLTIQESGATILLNRDEVTVVRQLLSALRSGSAFVEPIRLLLASVGEVANVKSGSGDQPISQKATRKAEANRGSHSRIAGSL